jgi:small subunit ribosomal protein S9
MEAVLREQQLDKQGRAYATGRRKDAVARVWLKPGTGKITSTAATRKSISPARRCASSSTRCSTSPSAAASMTSSHRHRRRPFRPGRRGPHGISQALTRYEPALRTTVKREGFLTRDPRVVERKKYGRAKARRSFQFSKR